LVGVVGKPPFKQSNVFLSSHPWKYITGNAPFKYVLLELIYFFLLVLRRTSSIQASPCRVEGGATKYTVLMKAYLEKLSCLFSYVQTMMINGHVHVMLNFHHLYLTSNLLENIFLEVKFWIYNLLSLAIHIRSILFVVSTILVVCATCKISQVLFLIIIRLTFLQDRYQELLIFAWDLYIFSVSMLFQINLVVSTN
jgi:hypothetical protein